MKVTPRLSHGFVHFNVQAENDAERIVLDRFFSESNLPERIAMVCGASKDSESVGIDLVSFGTTRRCISVSDTSSLATSQVREKLCDIPL